MAEFQTWDRQVLAQGQLVAPKAGPSIGEAFGQGLMDLAETAGRTVESIQKTDEWKADKEWEIDQPQAAADFTSLKSEVLNSLPDLQAQSASGLADYPDKVDALITRLAAEKMKGGKSQRWQSYWQQNVSEFRSAMSVASTKEKAAAGYALIASQLQRTAADERGIVAAHPEQFDASVKHITDLIESQSVFGRDQKDQLIRDNTRDLAVAVFNRMINQDADAAETLLGTGKFNGILTEEDKLAFRDAIKSEKELKQARIVEQAKQEAITAQSEVFVKYKDGFDQAAKDGKYDPGLDALIAKTFPPEDAKKMVDDLHGARNIGLDNISIPLMAPEEERRFLSTRDFDSRYSKDPWAKRRAENAQQRIYAKHQALKNDPEGYVHTYVPAVSELWDKAEKSNFDPSSVQQAGAASRRVQQIAGVQPERIRVIPQAMFDRLIKDVEGEHGAAAIAQIQESFGADMMPEFIAKAGKSGPLVQIALMLEGSQQSGVRAKLLELHRLGGVPVLEDNLRPSSSAWSGYAGAQTPDGIRNLVKSKLEELRPSFVEQGEGGKQVFSRLVESVYALTLDQMEGKKGTSASEASDLATAALATDHYTVAEFNSHAYRIPNMKGGDLIPGALEKYMKQFDYSKVDRPIGEAVPLDQLPELVRLSAYWTTLGNEKGIYLRLPSGTPVKVGGKDVVLTWEQLLPFCQ